MKIYIESLEDSDKENPDFIKEEVIQTKTEKKKTEQDYEDRKKDNKKLIRKPAKEEETKTKVKNKEKKGITYTRRKHYCRHEEKEPCTTEVI